MLSRTKAVFFIVLISVQNNGCFANCNDNYRNCHNKGKDYTFWETVKETATKASENKIVSYGIKTAAVAAAAIVAAPVVVGAAGFGTAGVVGGSAAAAVKSAWFGGAVSGLTGSVFAGLQSIGAAGLGLAGKSAIVTASGTVVKYFSGAAGGDECASTKSNKESRN